MIVDKKKYNSECQIYKGFGINLKESLRTLLQDERIDCLEIQYRVKKYESFIEKAEKKQYGDPLVETEDICGLRIICYYISDVEKIRKIIEKEFKVINSIDKEKELEVDRFGYRSIHFVVTVKNKWLYTPNYRNCGKLKAEIQVRTILMHAWAEIEHKLSYKNETDVPKSLKRRLSRLSALIEIADEQFEQIREDKKSYIKKITPKGDEKFDLNQEMNVDTFQAFMNRYLPKREKSTEATSDLLKELLPLGISFKTVLDSYNKAESYLAEASAITRNIPQDKWAQVGAIRLSLELTNDKYYNSRVKKYERRYSSEFTELRKKITREKSN